MHLSCLMELLLTIWICLFLTSILLNITRTLKIVNYVMKKVFVFCRQSPLPRSVMNYSPNFNYIFAVAGEPKHLSFEQSLPPPNDKPSVFIIRHMSPPKTFDYKFCVSSTIINSELSSRAIIPSIESCTNWSKQSASLLTLAVAVQTITQSRWCIKSRKLLMFNSITQKIIFGTFVLVGGVRTFFGYLFLDLRYQQLILNGPCS